MNPELLPFVVMGAGLVAYALTGGADFGAGVWDLLARGPRRDAQRAAIERAIAPIWEANHVWLIFVIVVMFTAYPRAFAAIGIALHLPIVLALIGIVLRGAAFTFRAYGMDAAGSRETWRRVFAWSSVLTPVFLGLTLAGVSSGDIRLELGPAGTRVTSGFVAGWTTPFAALVGAFALVLFAMLAAVYLAAESDGEVREDFRRRALGTELLAGGRAGLVSWRAWFVAPEVFAHLSPPVGASTAAVAVAAIAFLFLRRFRLARIAAALQVALVVVGWGIAMDGHLVRPDLPVSRAGLRPEVLESLGPVLAAGSILLLPSLWFLFRVFKTRDQRNRASKGT